MGWRVVRIFCGSIFVGLLVCLVFFLCGFLFGFKQIPVQHVSTTFWHKVYENHTNHIALSASFVYILNAKYPFYPWLKKWVARGDFALFKVQTKTKHKVLCSHPDRVCLVCLFSFFFFWFWCKVSRGGEVHRSWKFST